MNIFKLALGFLLAEQALSFSALPSLINTRTTTQLQAVTLDGKEIRGPITPLGNFVLVKTKETLSATDGGILLPDQAKERPTEGEVVEAGPGKLHPHTGVRIHCPVKPGDSVLHGKFDGTNLMYNDEQMNMIRDDDIMLYYTGTRMTLENVTPCRDYVLVKNDSASLETKSGIVVAGSATKGLEPCEGRVIKVGEGRMCSTGEFTPSPVAVGDTVKFRDYAGNGVRIEGQDYSLVRMVDILCAIDKTAYEEAKAAAAAEEEAVAEAE